MFLSNCRSYALRRIKDAFWEHKLETDPATTDNLMQTAHKNMEIIKRQVSFRSLLVSFKKVKLVGRRNLSLVKLMNRRNLDLVKLVGRRVINHVKLAVYRTFNLVKLSLCQHNYN